jgi:hypothetical protein
MSLPDNVNRAAGLFLKPPAHAAREIMLGAARASCVNYRTFASLDCKYGRSLP